MDVICLIIFSVLTIFSYINDHKIYSPKVTFCLLYTLIVYFARQQRYGLYAVPDIAYIIVCVGVVCYFLGASLGTFQYRRKQNNGTTYSFLDYFDPHLYKIAFYIALALSISYSIGALLILARGGTLYDIYQLHMGNGVNDSANELQHSFLDNLLSVYILTPLSYFLTPLSICIYMKNGEKKYLYWGFLLALFRVIYHGGRAALVFAILYFIVMFFVMKNKRDNELLFKKIRKILTIVTTLSILLFVSMTVGRDEDFGRNMYLYAAGAMPNFAVRIPQMYSYDTTFGFLSFRGFLYPFFSLGGALTGSDSQFFDYVDSVFNDAQIAEFVGGDIEMNAFVTCFYYFIIDGGIIGLILGSFIFGYISQYIYEKMMLQNTLFYLTIFAIFYVNVILYSSNAFMLSYIQVAWALVYTVLFFRMSKRNRKIFKY